MQSVAETESVDTWADGYTDLEHDRALDALAVAIENVDASEVGR